MDALKRAKIALHRFSTLALFLVFLLMASACSDNDVSLNGNKSSKKSPPSSSPPATLPANPFEDAEPAQPIVDHSIEYTYEFDCVREGSPCVMSEVPDEAFDRSTKLLGEALQMQARGATFRETAQFLSAQDDVVGVHLSPGGVVFRVKDGLPVPMMRTPMADPETQSDIQQLQLPLESIDEPSEGGARGEIERSGDLQVRRQAVAMTSRSVVGKKPASSEVCSPKASATKKALFLDAWKDEWGTWDKSQDVRNLFSRMSEYTLDYFSNTDVTEDKFSNWDNYDVIIVLTHGVLAGKTHLLTRHRFGVVEHEPDDEWDEEAYDAAMKRCNDYLKGLSKSNQVGKACTAHGVSEKQHIDGRWQVTKFLYNIILYVDSDYFAQKYEGKLSDKIISINACEGFKSNDLSDALVGHEDAEHSIAFGWTDIAFVGHIYTNILKLLRNLSIGKGSFESYRDTCGAGRCGDCTNKEDYCMKTDDEGHPERPKVVEEACEDKRDAIRKHTGFSDAACSNSEGAEDFDCNTCCTGLTAPEGSTITGGLSLEQRLGDFREQTEENLDNAADFLADDSASCMCVRRTLEPAATKECTACCKGLADKDYEDAEDDGRTCTCLGEIEYYNDYYLISRASSGDESSIHMREPLSLHPHNQSLQFRGDSRSVQPQVSSGDSLDPFLIGTAHDGLNDKIQLRILTAPIDTDEMNSITIKAAIDGQTLSPSRTLNQGTLISYSTNVGSQNYRQHLVELSLGKDIGEFSNPPNIKVWLEFPGGETACKQYSLPRSYVSDYDTLVFRSKIDGSGNNTCHYNDSIAGNFCQETWGCEVDVVRVVNPSQSVRTVVEARVDDMHFVTELLDEHSMTPNQEDLCWSGNFTDTHSCSSVWQDFAVFEHEMVVTFAPSFLPNDEVEIYRQSQDTAGSVCRASGLFDVFMESSDGTRSKQLNNPSQPFSHGILRLDEEHF